MRKAFWLLALALAFIGPRPAWSDFIGHGAPVRDVVLSPDGHYAATAGFDDLAILWSVAERRQLTRFYGHGAGVNAVAFLPPQPGGTLPRIVTVSDDGTGRIWDGDTGSVIHILEGHAKKVVGVAVSPDGKTIATASWDRTLRLWDADTGTLLDTLEGHADSVNDLVFSPAGDRLYSVGYDGSIRVWPLGGEDPPFLFARVGFPINGVALSGDGTTLVTGSADRTVRVWNTGDRSLVREWAEVHDGAVLSVAISADGRSFASGGVGGTLLLWDGGDDPRIELQVEHYRAVWSLAFSPDGTVIHAAGIDSVVRAWDTDTGRSVEGETTRFQPVERVSRALADSDDPVERGSYQFRKCAICHSLQDDGITRSGPSLAGLFGRRAGTYPGYHFSDALNDSPIIWNDETVARLFEIGPDAMFPGTKMPVQRLQNPQDRADLVAFLKQATAPD